jgi:dihydrolipoamide dehydrogenase
MSPNQEKTPAGELDLTVIGGGPGGYVAAIRAAQLGLRVALVEKDPLGAGGTCLWRGCIPTKSLLQSAETLDLLRRSQDFGVRAEGVALDVAGVHKRKDKVVRQLGRGVEGLLKKRRVVVRPGTGRILEPGRVEVRRSDGQVELLQSRNVIIATGSAPTQIPIAPFDGKRIISSDHLLELQSVPATLVIIGAGAVGVEFASIYASFGSKVTIVEALPRLLPIEDDDSSRELAKAFQARGIRILTSTRLTGARVDEAAGEVRVQVQGPEGQSEELRAERLLVAVGRRPFLEGLGLETTGIELQKGTVPVDQFLQTPAQGIYAIGDVVATPQLAHVATAEGILAVDRIAGKDRQPLDYRLTPSCTYCHPEVASVGLTERAAREQGYNVRTGIFHFSHLGRALILGETEGFVKVVADERYDEVLGVHIVGPRATDLIGEACAALKMEATVEEIARVIHPHPTLTEGYFEASNAVYGQAIHM